MLISRRVLREKAFQAVYAYIQQSNADWKYLEDMGHDLTGKTVTEQAKAHYALRTELHPHAYIDKDSYERLQQEPLRNTSTAYSTFYTKILHDYEKNHKKNVQNAIRTFTEAVKQIVINYYLILNVYLAVYQRAKNKAVRFGKSPLLAALDETGQLPAALQRLKLPEKPPENVLIACYNALILDETPSQDPAPNWEEDCRYLYRIIRKKWMKTPLLTAWMEEQDRCWSVHKPLIQGELIMNFKDCQKNKENYLTLANKFLNLEEELSFGETLCEGAIVGYKYWSEKVANHAENWESKRILLLDQVLIVLALTEITKMKEIPTRVSMNEYIEIAKVYSSPKSSTFVNALLEAVVKSLE